MTVDSLILCLFAFPDWLNDDVAAPSSGRESRPQWKERQSQKLNHPERVSRSVVWFRFKHLLGGSRRNNFGPERSA